MLVEATVWMLPTDDGGLLWPLLSPLRSLLVEPADHQFREGTGWDGFGVQITTFDDRPLAPGQGAVAVELLFWAEEAAPWVQVGSGFHLVVPPRRVGSGRVTRDCR